MLMKCSCLKTKGDKNLYLMAIEVLNCGMGYCLLTVMTAYWHRMFLSVNCILNDRHTANAHSADIQEQIFFPSVSRNFASFPYKVNWPLCLKAGWLHMCGHAVGCGSNSLHQFRLMCGKSHSSTQWTWVFLWLHRLDWVYTASSGLDKVDRNER